MSGAGSAPGRLDPLIAAKLAPPRLHSRSVPRHSMLGRLRQALAQRAAFITAPAGYGKTELLAQWWQALSAEGGRRLAWFSLDADDGQPAVFLSYAQAALGQPPHALAHAEAPSVRGAVARLLDGADSQPPTVLMLDDWERLDGALDALLALLIERLPAGWHLIVASRMPLDGPLAALVAQRAVAELGMADLRMGFVEASALLAPDAGEQRLSEGDIAFLLARTEGWPMALHLARAYVRSPAETQAPLLAYSGRAGELARYLTGAVWQAMAAHEQQALLCMASVPRSCAALLDHLTGRDDSAQWLDGLARRAVPLARLDAPGLWFQLHPLLVEHLQARLDAEQPTRRVAVQTQAARWLAAQGWLPDALRLARQTGDAALLAELLDAAGGWRLAFDGRIDLLRQHLGRLAPGQLLAWPRLGLAHGLLLLKSPQPAAAAQWLALLTQALGAGAEPKLALELQLVRSIVHAYTDGGLDAADADLAARLAQWRHELAAQPLRAPDGLLDGALANMHTYVLARLRRHAEAEAASREALKLLHAAGLDYIAAFVRFVQVGLAIDQGQLASAEQALARLSPAIADAFGSDSDLAAVADVLQAWLSVLQGDARRASGLLDGALAAMEGQDAWIDIAWAAYAARVGLAVLDGDAAAAQAALVRGQAQAAQRGMQRLALRLTLLQTELALAGLGGTPPDTPAGGYTAAAAPHAPHDRHLADAAALIDLRLAHAAGASDASVRWAQWADDALARGAGLQATEAWAQLAAAQAARADDQATTSLARAVALAAPAGLVLPLLQAGPALWPQLERLVAQRSSRSGGDVHARWLARLREALAQARSRPRAAPAHPLGLSAREAEVAALLCQGLSNKLMARELALSERTVKFHLAHVFAKLDVHNRADAIARLTGASG